MGTEKTRKYISTQTESAFGCHSNTNLFLQHEEHYLYYIHTPLALRSDKGRVKGEKGEIKGKDEGDNK